MSVTGISQTRRFDMVSQAAGYGATYTQNTTIRKRNNGPDTVSFSDEALTLAQRQGNGEGSSLSCSPQLELREKTVSYNAGNTSPVLNGKSMFAMLLESLFLADLEENAAEQSQAEGRSSQGESSGSRLRTSTASTANPLEDSKKARDIKKVLTDFAKGKADLSDITTAMAAGNAGSGGGVKDIASKGQDGFSDSPQGIQA